MNEAKRNPYANYQVGLVMTQAGMNPAQLSHIKTLLRQIAKFGGAEPDGLDLAVPVFSHHGGPKACEQVEDALRSLKALDYLRITILDVGMLQSVAEQLLHRDEVWCLPTGAYPQRNQRPSMLYALIKERYPEKLPKFKIIPPWVEAPVAEAKTSNQKVLKG